MTGCLAPAPYFQTGLVAVVVRVDGGGDSGTPDAGDAGPPDGGTRVWIIRSFPGFPEAMNGRGTIAFSTYSSSALFTEAFVRYADGGVEYVGGRVADGGVRTTYPTDIDEDDCVIGQTRVFDETFGGRPFLWCPQGTIQPLIADPNPFRDVRAYQISKAWIVGEVSIRPFLWSSRDAGEFLPTLGRGIGVARGVSQFGAVGYVTLDSGFNVGALWRDGGLELLTPPGIVSEATDIAESGAIYGQWYGSSGTTACVWRDISVLPVSLPVSAPGAVATVFGLGHGEIPFGFQNNLMPGRIVATAWIDGGPFLLDSLLQPDSGFELLNVKGMNGSGTAFVGQNTFRVDGGSSYLLELVVE